jgi:hypothetical protein
MADKYIIQDSGRLKENEASDTSAGVGDAGKIVALDDTGKLDDSLFPAGMGAEIKILPASGALNAGDFVNIFDDSGTLKVRKAIADAVNKEAHGFVLEEVADTADASVYCEGINNQLSGLTGGPRMYLSAATAGDATATAPSGTGEVVQAIGFRLSATEITFEPQEPIELA